ncbi:DUF305 domain-containing protein [Ilyomonas limi]|uniref:DUF305 domain-containing protein n=1 Tax=Ilyomonas limi TaxID=2575867 RepID=A0A4U3KVC2_9BACT|nr:DUF305 domain-containing protein [Ilyomonas limi]TKK66292.1 DUF305 domain-containing protein [Ilyomonas limi]
MNNKIKLAITLTAGVIFFSACNNGTATDKNGADTTTMSNMNSDTMDKKMDMGNTNSMNSGLMGSMNSMMDKMSSMQMSGDFDMDFANMMIEHHQGAIDMSEEELKSGKDEKMKTMAQKIITEQKEEQSKLKDFVKNHKIMKMDMGQHDQLSKEMTDMKASMSSMQMTGNTDKDFATMMIPHHESAVKMFKDELSYGMNAQLKQMAQKGISDQTKEIDEFKSWMSANK